MLRRTSVALVMAVFGLALVGCGTGGGPAPAVPRPAVDIPALKVVPDNALAVVVVKNLSDLDGKATKLTQALQMPAPPMLASIKDALHVKEGLDEKGSLIVAVLPGDHMPTPIVFVPVTDYDKFIAQFKPEKADGGISKVDIGQHTGSLVAKKGNYAAIVDGNGEEALKAAISAKDDISSTLKPASGWMAEQDIAAVATPAGIKAAIGPARQGLQMAKQSFPADKPELANVAAAFDMYESMLKACEEDVTQAAIGLKLDKDSNAHVTSHWGFKSGGPLAKSLANLKPLPQKPLADLPAGPFIVAGTGIMPQHMMEGYLSMMRASPQFAGLKEEQMKKMEALMTDFTKGVESMSLVLGVPHEKQALMSNMTAVVRVDNARKYMDMLIAKMPEFKQVYKDAKIPGADSYEMKTVDLNGSKGLEFKMDVMAAMPSNLPAGSEEQMKKVLQVMLGSDGKMTVTYVVADDKTILEFMSSGDDVKKKLAEYKNRSGSLASDPHTAKTVALLPADAQWVGVWDVPGTLNTVKQVMAAIAPDGPAGKIPMLPAMPPIGFSATATGESVDTDLVLPVDTIKEVAKKSQEAMRPQPEGAQ